MLVLYQRYNKVPLFFYAINDMIINSYIFIKRIKSYLKDSIIYII